MSNDPLSNPEDVELSERSTILDVLERAPGMIARKSKLVAESDRAKRLAKRAVDVARAKATIQHKEQRNKEIIQAYVEFDPEVDKAEAALIAAIANHKIAEIEFERVYNLFISARKVGGMSDTEMKVLHGSIAGVSRDKEGNRVDMRTGEILG